jgi:peptide/nickel transport system permease protein
VSSIVATATRGTSLGAIAVGQFRRSIVGLVGLALVALFLMVTLLAPWLAPYDPIYADFANVLAPPSWPHPCGTDDIGRDILSRVIYGSRISLSAGLAPVAFALVVGLPLGLLAGYAGGTIDNVLMRAVEVILAFPTLVLALGITAILGPKLSHALLAIGLVFVPNFARLIRGQVLSVRENDFVTAARALGGSDTRVVVQHVLPNCVAPLLVQSSFAISFAILVEAALSFLGLGTQPPTPSWGIMLSQGRGYLEQAPWLGAFPGLAIFLTVLGFNLVGDGLRDALDPRLKS